MMVQLTGVYVGPVENVCLSKEDKTLTGHHFEGAYT